jgi:hypothetical protein
MRLEKSIVLHATEDAKRKWEGKELPKKDKKSSCPACDLQDLKKENDYINKENKQE